MPTVKSKKTSSPNLKTSNKSKIKRQRQETNSKLRSSSSATVQKVRGRKKGSRTARHFANLKKNLRPQYIRVPNPDFHLPSSPGEKKKPAFLKVVTWKVYCMTPHVPAHTYADVVRRRAIYRKSRHLIGEKTVFRSWLKRQLLIPFLANYCGSFVVRDEPVEVSRESTVFYEDFLRRNANVWSDLGSLGRAVSFYYPDLINIRTEAWSSEIITTPYSYNGNKLPHGSKPSYTVNHIALLNTFARCYKNESPFMRLRFWDWIGGLSITSLAPASVSQLSKNLPVQMRPFHVTRQDGLGLISASYCTMLRAQELLTLVGAGFGACCLKLFFRARLRVTKGPGDVIKKAAYIVLRKKISRNLLWFLKIERVVSVARQRFLTDFKTIWVNKLSTAWNMINTKALTQFNWNFNFEVFLEQYSKHMVTLEIIENKRLFSNRHSTGSVMGLRFLARLNHLLTKRGHAYKAFKCLVTLRNLMKRPTAPALNAPVKLNKFIPDMWLTIMWNLRTYFYQRKFTEGRKTIFIPGILRARKRLRIAARWFAVVTRRKKLGVRLLEVLLDNARAVYAASGPSVGLRKDFNDSVRNNKINIQPKRGARRFKINPEGPLPKKNVVVKPRPRRIPRPSLLPFLLPRDVLDKKFKTNESTKSTKKKTRY